jgi:hypothetical protein
MPSTYSSLKIELMATGENNTTWGGITNTNLGTALEEAIVGSADVAFSNANITLTLTNTNATQTARNVRLNLTGTATAGYNLVVPAIEKPYIINNGTDGTITVKNTTGTGIAVPAGKTMWVFNNGTNVVDVVTHLSSVTLGSALPVTSGGTGVTTSTGTGSVVRSTSPTLVTPTLGVASATSIANGLGLVAGPSYTFTGNLDTGIWSPSANIIAFSTTGIEAMRITPGVFDPEGGETPGELRVSGQARFGGTAGTIVGSTGIRVGPDRGSSIGDAFVIFFTSGNTGVYDSILTRGGGSNTDLNLVNRGTGNIAITAENAGAVVTKTSNTERMRVTSAGNVGIGTTAPTQRVDIRGGDLLVSRGAASVAEDATIYFGNNNNNFIFGGDNNAMAFYTNGSQRMFLASNGTVGIGTGTPGAKLEVRDTGNTVVLIAGDSTSATQLNFDANTSAVISQKMNAPIIFETNLTEKMRITGGGVVGIGTISPSAAARLEVSSSTSGFLPPRMTTTQRDAISSPPNGLMLYNSTTDKLQVRAAGAWVDLH